MNMKLNILAVSTFLFLAHFSSLGIEPKFAVKTWRNEGGVFETPRTIRGEFVFVQRISRRQLRAQVEEHRRNWTPVALRTEEL